MQPTLSDGILWTFTVLMTDMALIAVSHASSLRFTNALLT